MTRPGWTAATALKGYWTGAVAIPAEEGARPRITYDWFRDFLKYMLDHEWYTWFAKLVAIGEFLVGLGLVVGALVGIAAFFGTVLNFNFMLAGTTSTNPVLFALTVFLVLGWKVAGWIGLDRFLLPLLGTPWNLARSPDATRRSRPSRKPRARPDDRRGATICDWTSGRIRRRWINVRRRPIVDRLRPGAIEFTPRRITRVLDHDNGLANEATDRPLRPIGQTSKALPERLNERNTDHDAERHRDKRKGHVADGFQCLIGDCRRRIASIQSIPMSRERGARILGERSPARVGRRVDPESSMRPGSLPRRRRIH